MTIVYDKVKAYRSDVGLYIGTKNVAAIFEISRN